MEKLAITIFPHRSKQKELLGACRLIGTRTLEVGGCMDSRVVSGSGEDGALRIAQHWRKRDLLEDYFRSDHFTALLGAMKLLAISYEMTINDGSPSEGAIFVDRARNRK